MMTTNSPLATTYSAMVPWLTRLMQMVAATNSPHAATVSAIMPVLTRLMQVVAATLRQAVPQLTRGITISVGVGGAVVVVTTKKLELTTIMTTDSPLATTDSAIMPWLTRLTQMVAATLRQAVPQLTRGVTISVGVGVSQTGGKSGDPIRMTGSQLSMGGNHFGAW